MNALEVIAISVYVIVFVVVLAQVGYDYEESITGFDDNTLLSIVVVCLLWPLLVPFYIGRVIFMVRK